MRKVGLIVMVEMVPIVAQLVKFGTDGDSKHVGPTCVSFIGRMGRVTHNSRPCSKFWYE